MQRILCYHNGQKDLEDNKDVFEAKVENKLSRATWKAKSDMFMQEHLMTRLEASCHTHDLFEIAESNITSCMLPRRSPIEPVRSGKPMYTDSSVR